MSLGRIWATPNARLADGVLMSPRNICGPPKKKKKLKLKSSRELLLGYYINIRRCFKNKGSVVRQ